MWIRLPHVFCASTLVAVRIVLVGWIITFVSGHYPGVLVGLHYVNLLAEVATDLIGVAIVSA